uniref:Uncharacterized protein n=1 Tax=Arundo donax TaxID=35708 RepID=A0A0A9GUQ2_ARUDO
MRTGYSRTWRRSGSGGCRGLTG